MTPTARDTTPTALRRTPIVADNATRLPLRLLLPSLTCRPSPTGTHLLLAFAGSRLPPTRSRRSRRHQTHRDERSPIRRRLPSQQHPQTVPLAPWRKRDSLCRSLTTVQDVAFDEPTTLTARHTNSCGGHDALVGGREQRDGRGDAMSDRGVMAAVSHTPSSTMCLRADGTPAA